MRNWAYECRKAMAERDELRAKMPKNFDSMSDALGFADGADAGKVLRFYRSTEFFFDGVRLNPGTYELRKVPDTKPSNHETSF